MPRMTYRPPFDPAKPVRARYAMVCNGHRFKAGDIIPWRRLALNKRRVKQMYDAYRVHQFDVDAEPQGAPDDSAAPAQTAAPTMPQPATPDYGEGYVEAGVMQAESDVVREQDGGAQISDDDLYDITSLKRLKAIAEDEGAPTRRSKDDQIIAIIENREAKR